MKTQETANNTKNTNTGKGNTNPAAASKGLENQANETDGLDPALLGLGAPTADAPAGLAVRSTLDEIPCFVPGQAGFEVGDIKAGTYVRTKKVVSNKFNNPKYDKKGKPYRLQHQLKMSNGKRFGIWGVSTLDHTLPSLKVGQYIAVKYLGVADKPLKEKQSPPHTFEFSSDQDIEHNPDAFELLVNPPEDAAVQTAN